MRHAQRTRTHATRPHTTLRHAPLACRRLRGTVVAVHEDMEEVVFDETFLAASNLNGRYGRRHTRLQLHRLCHSLTLNSFTCWLKLRLEPCCLLFVILDYIYTSRT